MYFYEHKTISYSGVYTATFEDNKVYVLMRYYEGENMHYTEIWVDFGSNKQKLLSTEFYSPNTSSTEYYESDSTLIETYTNGIYRNNFWESEVYFSELVYQGYEYIALIDFNNIYGLSNDTLYYHNLTTDTNSVVYIDSFYENINKILYNKNSNHLIVMGPDSINIIDLDTGESDEITCSSIFTDELKLDCVFSIEEEYYDYDIRMRFRDEVYYLALRDSIIECDEGETEDYYHNKNGYYITQVSSDEIGYFTNTGNHVSTQQLPDLQ